MLRALPAGRTLPAAAWERRHRWMVNLLWLHVPGLALVSALEGGLRPHLALELTPLALLALVAGSGRGSQRARALCVAFGLLSASALLVHMTHGLIESHFHFFVMMSVLTLYEDWLLFLVAVAYVLFHHAGVGLIDRELVYAHQGEPLKWAGVHALFVAGAGIANIIGWRLNEDVRAHQRRTAAALRDQALHDPLTGLGNRRLLTERLTRVGRSSVEPIAIFLLDLDGFKMVNDTYGHAAGDRLLVEVAARLRAQVRQEDTLARLGGDEFVLLCPGIGDEAIAGAFAERLAEAVESRVDVGEATVRPTCSIGFALGEGRFVDSDELLRRADIAMQRAKDRGPGQMERGTRKMLDDEVDRRALRERIELAVEREEFSLRYQPLVDVRTGSVEAVEALIRWEDPARGTVPPGGFLPAAEATGLIVAIGRWALGEACRQAAAWNAEYMDRAPIRMFVNASAREFGERGFAENVLAAARAAGIELGQLTIEVTESMMMEKEELTEVAFGLTAAGVQVALDDFGAAYSSLGRLAAMPLDVVKIDREFVSGRSRSGVVMRAVGHMAREMNLRPVAEGVETSDQLALAVEAGFDLAQGFYFAPPLTADELVPLLARECPFVDHLPSLSVS